MDKNTITGFVLMGIVLVVFTWLGRPSAEQIEMQQRMNDSIALVHQQQREIEEAAKARVSNPIVADSTALDNLSVAERDSILNIKRSQTYGEMSRATIGKEELYTLENDSVAYTFSNKGGMLIGSELKQYQDYLGEPIRLIRPEEASISFNFITRTNRVINTNELYFKGEKMGPNQLKLTTTSNSGEELALIYTLKNRYILDLQIVSNGFDKVLASNAPFIDGSISLPIYQNEKSFKSEQRYSGMAYEHSDGSVDKLSTAKSTSKEMSGTVKWVAFRDMFFSTFVYSPQGLKSLEVTSDVLKGGDNLPLKDLEAKFVMEISHDNNEPLNLLFYTGPNDYALLKHIDKSLKQDDTHLTKIVEMGGWFRFINIWIIQPVFNFLERFISNYGLIIFLLTLFIKMLLMPFTYKSYMSQAKMRVLRPQIEVINEKYPGQDNMMKRQQETMALYQKAGVSTMGGCLPMLLQMPILVAMYQYFPTSINLRGESFLWAEDLSTYDDVIRFGVDIPFIGDHISLFCLLMTITQVIYMNYTTKNSGQEQMPFMKWMPYLMAIMLFSFLNQNASGLSYYYLLSMLITIVQTQGFKWAVNEEKILAKLEANKKKPKKKSKFMQRLEEAQKQQEKMLKEQRNNKKGR
ncbi:membrane protein insertase YidC [Porphyromonadaceae bacterium W3.11]|nr:membrane protein insertase YidC [Porphyromonadaceae bacterium W3.11]